jgi:hypothetical protein
MDERGLLGGDDPASAAFRQMVVAGMLGDLTPVFGASELPREKAGENASLSGIRDYLRQEVLLAVSSDKSNAERGQIVPDTTNSIVADLRAQLAESRGETKLAEAISRSDLKHTELIGRVDAGFADIRGQISSVNVRLDGIEKSTMGLRAAIFGTGVASVAVVIAILAYGQAWFGIGVSTREVVRATVMEVLQGRTSTNLGPTTPPTK